MTENIPETPTPKKRRWARRLGIALAVLLALVAGAIALVNSPIGKRFIADQIAQVAPASGLTFEVGRIEGDIFRKATLHDVVVADPKGVFLRIPEAEIDWRPLSWLSSGLDIRKAVARRGILLRLPELLPGDPDAPILPNFDIRIDRLALEDFTLAAGVVDDQTHVVNLQAKTDIRDGRAMIKASGTLGEQDRFAVDLDAEPDGNVFDLALDYDAPQGGVIAGLVGAKAGYAAKIRGGGSWQDWRGYLALDRNDKMIGGFRLTNKAGLYGIVGQVDPRGPLSEGLAATALGPQLRVAAFTTLENSVLDGAVRLRGAGVTARADGTVDLASNAFDTLEFAAQLTDPDLLGETLRLEMAQIAGTLNGGFRDLTISHRLDIGRLVAGTTIVSAIAQEGRARYDGTRFTLPVAASVGQVETGTALIDPKLVDGKLAGLLVLTGDRLQSERMRLNFPGASAQLALDGDLAASRYRLTGPVAVNGLEFDNIGSMNAGGDIDLLLSADAPWRLAADFNGTIPSVTNTTLANLAGPRITFGGGVTVSGAGPIDFRAVTLNSAKLQLQLNGAITGAETSLAGTGQHADYGPFTVEGALKETGPEAVLVFADPLPAAGLRDVRVGLSPTEDGFAIETEGESLLGPFVGTLGLFSPADGPTRIAVQQFSVWKTEITGDIALGEAGASGTLALAGGGLDGTIAIMPRAGGQFFNVDVKAQNATFGGEIPISVARAEIDGTGLLVDGNSTIEASVFAQGLRYNSLFIGRLAANAELVNGAGEVTASLSGRRGSRFALQLNADVAPDRIAIASRGDYGGRRISMPRRAVVSRQGDGWSLAPTQISYGNGRLVAGGSFGGRNTALDLALDGMPLGLIDVTGSDLGLGGTISGTVEFDAPRGGLPTGEARVKVAGFTRSGLLLTSRPSDLSLVAKLSADRLDARAVIADDEGQRGRLQARITGLPQSGGLADRINAGDLFSQLRYSGPAQSLWRLAAIGAFDLTGPIAVAANVRGSVANPRVLGSVRSDNLRLQSSLSGTDVRNITARGNFAGSRLRLTRFSGTAVNGGAISGSGVIDLANLSAARGPDIDLRISAKNAQLLDALGLDATVTGPLRIISNGAGGTIAGKLSVDRASWALGISADDVSLPVIKTREINAPADIAPPRTARAPWRYLINATARNRVDVDGLGLDSEWSANIRLRGTTDDPRIGGSAQVVRGFYSFAGTRFELTRGRITFDESVPIDPRIDIIAETDQNGVDVNVSVQGSAVQPEISFQSSPALPEEEILARLLFGGSVTDLSATDAVQLGAALASLRGGGGLDPINQLRSAIGLDRLRIVGADPALDRGTGVALGKNLGRRFYVELITDGRGYSASEIEFRVSSWLSILAAVSTIGRESVVAEVSRDY
ncbi:translocation/assembly module TamB domain-containing protein [Altererythrobacter sp.]|nr:translocation/assembly module TamB domain-containing protein [Altererythrobacter sp.]